MRKRKLQRTDQTNVSQKSAAGFGHNLNLLLSEMNISHIIPKVDTENGKQLEAESLHQAWRYGKRLNEQQEERSTRELTKILGELKKELL